MIKRLISFFLTLVFLAAIPLEARYRYNPYTRKLDFYEAAADIVLGDIGDITLTGLAAGDIIYYDGAAWVNLAAGGAATVLTIAAGIPSWQAAGAPGAHAASHEVGGADLVDHDQLTNYLAAQHLTLPNTIVAVLTDHNKAAHDALLIDADTVDGEHAAAIVTNARVKAHFPDTIANILSDHNLAAHPATLGGTGLGVYVIGDILYASGVGTLSRLADVAIGAALMSGGVGVAPAWDASPSFTGLVSSVGLTTTSQMNISTTDLNGIVFGLLGTATRGIDLSGSGLAGAADYWIYNNATNTWSDNQLRAGIVRADTRVITQRLTTLSAGQDLQVDAGTFGNAIIDLQSISLSSFLVGDRNPVGSLTNCTSNTTTTIAKAAAWGFLPVAGDLVHIQDATTAADEGFYRVVSVIANTSFVVDRALTGADADVDVKFYQDVIGFFATDGTNGQRIMNYSHQDKPLQIGGDTLQATSGLGSEDVIFGGIIGLVNGEEFQHGDYVISTTVNWDDASPVAICTVADGYTVTDVWCEVTTVADGDLVWTVGDGATADGFLTDAGITQGAAAYYGQVHSARGTYLFNAGEEVDKIYTGADTVDCFITESTASQGVIVVYVHITRLK